MWLPRTFLLLCLAGFSLVLCSCSATDCNMASICFSHPAHAPMVCGKPTVMNLARDIDDLEKTIDHYGTVTAGQTSVWGQARLMMHRQEFEEVMKEDLEKFTHTLQGSNSRSDQAYLANAMSLSAAVSGSRAVARGPQASSQTTVLQQADPADPKTLVSGADTVIQRSAAATFQRLGFQGQSTGIIQIEPTLYLAQKARYLNYLHELRRLNEGDDTADSPGYSLNLLSIPVSVLPGKKTMKGYGAEATFTIRPYLGDELLPTTFRNLVVSDIVHQIGFPLTQLLNDAKIQQVYLKEDLLDAIVQLPKRLEKIIGEEARSTKNRQELRDALVMVSMDVRFQEAKVRDKLHGLIKSMEAKGIKEATSRDFRDFAQKISAIQSDLPPNVKSPAFDQVRNTVEEIIRGKEHMENIQVEFLQKSKLADDLRETFVAAPAVPTVKGRNARLSFPPSELFEVYGYDLLYRLAFEANTQFQGDPLNKNYIHYPVVQSFLQEELSAAYEFLSNPRNQDLWSFCTPQLAFMIRSKQQLEIRNAREHFQMQIEARTPVPTHAYINNKHHPVKYSTTAALAWAILCESALLNERLVQDMKELSSLRGCLCNVPDWTMFAGPNPPPEARKLFNDYVHCRWPIHVFALDPTTQDQNIADTYSMRREMQLAMSMAFVSGQISARQFTQFVRRLEYDMETIDLNRTSVGFSHGPDTFGWRFYPRFQTPDVEGNATVLVRDLMIGGPNKNALLNDRRLEPGIRECVALVIMPSFVPYATLEAHGNWFKITNPRHKELKTTDLMRMSKTIRALQECGPNIIDADCYRGGDVGNLLQRVEQLSARLPLQTQSVQVPHENTLGGFAMFNTGVTDLAPELFGWYGHPGIDLTQETTLFLVGNGFSVHQTEVLVGGQRIGDGAIEKVDVTRKKLLSRNVMEIRIQKGASYIIEGSRKLVTVHIATPYGVSNHLLVPVFEVKSAAVPKATTQLVPVNMGIIAAWDQKKLELAFQYEGGGIARPNNPRDVPSLGEKLTLTLDTDLGEGKVDIELGFSGKFKDVRPIILTDVALKDKKLTISGEVYARLVQELFRPLEDQNGPRRFGSIFGLQQPPELVKMAVRSISIQAPVEGKLLKFQYPAASNSDLEIIWRQANAVIGILK
jgi:hypothetical protein